MAHRSPIPFKAQSIRIDRATFEVVYQLYWEKVYTILYNQLREAEPAREIVQDIFKSLWERRETLIMENAEHYLIRAAKLKAFEYIRNKVSREKHIHMKMSSCDSSTNCTEEHILFNSLKGKVNDIVDTLPCQCRRVYRMSMEEGMANKEIAQALLITERAVAYHMAKATSTLRLELAEYSS